MLIKSISGINLLKFVLLFILVLVGVSTKLYSGFASEFVINYLGGVIYVVFFIVLASLVFPKARSIKISLIVLCITFLLEFSQLIQFGFLNSLRKYFVIRALIGSIFNVFDFVFYVVGAVIGQGVLLILKNRIKE